MNKTRNILFVLILCTLVVYSNHFDNSFHFDDSHTIVNNLSIRKLTVSKFFTDGSTFSSLPANQSYRPVVTILNAIDHSLSKNGNTFWFHVSIFSSFIVAGILLFLFIRHLLAKTPGARFNNETALFITGWFWLHPANAETINYIIARSDSFSTCMVLLSFVMYCRWPFAKKTFLYLLPFVIGFLAKETAIMFLPLLFFYELLFVEKTAKANSLRKIGGRLLVPAVLTIALLLVYKEMLPGSWQTGGDHNKVGYWMTQPYAILHYFGNFLIPVDLVADTDWELVTTVSDPRFILASIFLILLLFLAIFLSVKPGMRIIAFGLIWFLLALLPTSLIPLAEVMNDHRTFFPYIGLFVAMAGALQLLLLRKAKLLENKRVVFLLQTTALLLFAFMAMATVQRNKVWHSEYSLWKEVTRKAPGNGRGWMNYGLAQMGVGDYPGAETSYSKALDLLPGYSYTYINLGILKHATGDKVKAEEYFKTALTFGMNNPEAYAWYADYLLKQKRFNDAGMLIEKGLAISPNHEMLARLKTQLNSGN